MLLLDSGDVELGDALISSVEGKASAIEESLLTTPQLNPPSLIIIDAKNNVDDIFG